MKTKKKVKAVLCRESIVEACGYSAGDSFWKIPATAEAYEAMVEQMWVVQVMLTHLEIKRLLAAIGVTPPTK